MRFIDFLKKNKLVLVISLGLLGGLVLRLAYAAHLPLSNDEGSYLYDGLLLSQGKWPFLTSFSRAPVLMFLTSGVVRVFGRSFLAGRMISILAGLGSAWLLYLIGQRLINRRVGVLALLFYALSAPCVVHTIYLHTQPLELFFVLVGIWFVLREIGEIREMEETGGVGGFVLAGMFFGLAVLVRETAALYPAVAVAAILLLARGIFWRRVWSALVLGVSSLAVWGSVWVFVVRRVGFARVRAVFLAIMTMHDTGEYMSFGFKMKKKFEIFYGALGENFLLYFLVVVFAVFLVARLVRVLRGAGRLGRNWVFLLLFVSVPFLFYGLYYRRLQAEYLAEFMPAMVLMSAVALDQMIESVKGKMQSVKSFAVPIAIVFGLPLLAVNYRYQWEHQHGGTFAPEALGEVLNFLEDTVPPDEEIFTAAVIVPFLSGHKLAFDISRPVIFGYPHLAPEVKYALFPTDDEVLAHLAGHPVRWVIFDKTTRDTFFRGHPEIEKYLQENYNVVKVVPNDRTGTIIEIAARRE